MRGWRLMDAPREEVRILNAQSALQLDARRSPRSLRWRAVVRHAAAVAVFLLFHFVVDSPVVSLVGGGAVFFPVYLWLAWDEGRRAPLILSPLSFYFIWYSVGLGLSAIYAGSVIWAEEPIKFSVAIIDPVDLANGYAIFLVGSVSLHVGLAGIRPLSDTNSPIRHQPRPIIMFVFWLTGIAMRTSMEDFARFTSIIGKFQWSGVAILSSYALTYRKKLSMPFWTIVLVGICIELYLNLNSGSKAYIIYSLIPLFWVFTYRPALRPLLLVATMVSAVFYLVLAPRVQSVRVSRQVEGQSFASKLIQDFQETESVFDVDVREAGRGFLQRQFDPVAVGFISGEVARHGFVWGSQFDYLLYAFVPRMFFPDKPVLARGAWFTTYLGFSRSVEEATTATGQTATGELYWNFGWPGVIAGMALIGAFLGLLWRLAGAEPTEHQSAMILYTSLIFQMPNMAEAGMVVVGLVFTFVVFKGLIIVERHLESSRVLKALEAR